MGRKITLLESVDFIGEKTFEKVADEEKVRLLKTAMKALSPEMKAVLALYFIEGYTQVQIAQMLNTSRAAVCAKLKRAVDKLRRVMNAMR